MNKKMLLATLSLIASCMLPMFGQTTVYCPPSADAVVGSLSPSLNFGSSTLLLLGYDNVNIFLGTDPVGYGRSFIKYDLSSIPANATVSSAKIRLKQTGWYNPYDFTMTCFRVDQSWSEGTITWSNKPTNITEIASATYPVTNSSSFFLDITALAQEWVNGTRTNNGIVLVKGDAATNSAITYISKEHRWYPTNTQYYCLEVTYMPVVTNYTVSGRVTSRRWPYSGINGIKVDSDSGQTATTDWNGDYALYNVPQGSRTITAYHPNYDYWATGTNNTASQSFTLSSHRNDINFNQFACKGTAQVGISVSKTEVIPGETFNVTVSLTNINTALANVASYLDVSFPSEKFTVGTPTAAAGSWTNLTAYAPGSSIYHWDSSGNISSMTSYEYLISGERLNDFGFNSSYSYTFPVTVKSDAAAGTVLFKYRGTIGDERDPDSTGSGTLDQQGLNIYSTVVTVADAPSIDLFKVYRVSASDGNINTANPGSKKGVFTAGETVRITICAANLGGSIDVRTLLKISLNGNHSNVVFSGYNNYDSPLNTNEIDYYSFDWQIPIDATLGQYDLYAEIQSPTLGLTFKTIDWSRGFNIISNPDGITNYYGLLVGSGAFSNNRDSWDELVVNNDIIKTRDVLIGNSSNWTVNHISLLANDQVSRASIGNAIQILGNQMDGDDVLLFYYSGHGDENGLALFNLDGYGSIELTSDIDSFISFNAKKIIILNACHSGVFFEDFMESSRENTFLITSARADEVTPVFSLIFFPWNTSIFSFYFCGAIDGGGDGDENGEVSCLETYNYLNARIPLATLTLSHPQKYSSAGMDNAAITLQSFPSTSIPSIALNSPNYGVVVSQGQIVDISWGDSDSDSNATISLARDLDIVDEPWVVGEHSWLGSDSLMIAEDPDGAGDHYYWDTTLVPEGTYSIWAMIYDGVHAPRFARASGTVTISNILGQLNVNILPAEAIALGAQWKLTTDTIWRNSGTTIELASGSYEIEFKTISGWNKPINNNIVVVPGQLTQISGTYTGIPIINTLPDLLSPVCAAGNNAPGAKIYLYNGGNGTLNYTITDGGCAWLECSPASGNSTGETDMIDVTYSTSGLAAGSYNATITISDPNASNNPQTIPVNLTVNPVKTLSSIAIEGPNQVNENSTQDYNCRAYYSDGTNALVEPTWGENSAYASISGSGLLTTTEVPSDQSCQISASYSEGGVTKNATLAVTIKDVPVDMPIISGSVLFNSSPLSGVMMSGLPGNPVTDASGFYTSSVDYDWSGTVTPMLAGYAFTPASRSYSNVTSDQANQDYTAALAPSLQLTSPNGWEHWTLGSTKTITWNAINYTGTVRLVLFKAGSRFGNIVANIPATAGSYSWTVGQTYDSGMAPEGADYRLYLRSTDGTIIDPSDYRLALIDPAQLEVTAPNGGESWELGTTQNITWNANGYVGTVRLILFQKAAKIGQIVANLPAGQGSYAWTVGTHQAGVAPVGINYSIRLLAGDGSQEDYSDGPLTLTESDALVVDHQHTTLNGIPSEWLDQAAREKLLVLSPRGQDEITLGLRMLGDRDARLTPAESSNSLGLVLSEGSWLPQGASLDLQEWQWVLEKAILDSQATVAVVRPDEQALLAGRLNAESYLQTLSELAERLPQVKLVCSTAGMGEPSELLAKFNAQVRESVLRNHGVLFDAADIESWHRNQQHLANEMPIRHPAYRASTGAPATDNLANQGTAAWWLLARLAGWEGTDR